jgi:hypothetical protein
MTHYRILRLRFRRIFEMIADGQSLKALSCWIFDGLS